MPRSRLAKNAMTLSLPLQFETNGAVGRKVSEQIVYGLPDDWWERYRERVVAVEVDRTVEVLRRALAPAGLVGLAVGRAEAIVPDLEERFDRVEVVGNP